MSGPSAPLPAVVVAAGVAGEVAAACRPLPPLSGLVDRADAPVRPHVTVVLPPDPADPAVVLLLDRAEWLRDSGFDVTIVRHGDGREAADDTVHVLAGLDLVTAVPPCDVIVVGSWAQVGTARTLGIAPVVHLVADVTAIGTLPTGGPEGEHPAGEHAEHVAAALAAADLTLAVSEAVRDALDSEHGIGAHVVPAAAPAFEAAVPAAREAGSSVRILQFGWDGDPEVEAARGRKAAAVLRAAGHDVRLTLAMKNWPLEPLTEGEERVPVPRTAETLAALLDAVDVLLVPGTDAGRNDHLLAAFSRGVPVVAVHRDGDDLTADGAGALAAGPDELATALTRLVTEPELAATLRERGLATAARHAPAALGERLAELLRPFAAQRIEPTGAAWAVEMKGLEFDGGPAALQELLDRLPTIAAGQVAIPVSRPAFAGHRLVRWTVVARRKGGSGTVRLFVPARAAGPDARHRWRNGIKALTWNHPEEAVRFFLGIYRTADPATQALLWRWIAISALGINRPDDAMDAAASGLAVWPDHPDYHYLVAVAAAARGDERTATAELEQVRALGSAACRYDEWFADTEKLLTTRLTRAA